MIRRWPDTLGAPSIPGFTLRPRDQARRTDMEVGPKRVRRISMSALELVTAPWRFDAAQVSAFKDWYYDRRVSIAGASDSVAAWTLYGLTRTAEASLAPDLVAADRLEESAVDGIHAASLPLSEVAANGIPLVIRGTFRAAGRSRLRLDLVDRAGVLQGCGIDLATGLQTATYGSPTSIRIEPRGAGWWRVTVQAATGTGSGTPLMRVGLMDADGQPDYPGIAGQGIDICEVQARIFTGQDLFVPSDSGGFALGAAGGTAWFRIPLATDGREVLCDARMDQMWTAQLMEALSGEISLTMEVRNA